MALSLEQCRAANRRALAALADGDLGEAERWFEAQIDGDCGRFVNRTTFKADHMATIANPVDLTRTRRSTVRINGGSRFTPFDPTGGDPFGGGGGGGLGDFDPVGDPLGTLLETACALLGLSNCTVTNVIAAGGAALLGLGDDDTGAMDPSVPGTPLSDPGTNGCPEGSIQVRGTCVDPGAALPGGDPLFSPAGFQPVRGLNGAGFAPMQETRQVRVCPPDHVLGKDNVCYDSLPRTRRKWDPGMKPLMTGGDRAAIRKAARAARKLKRSKKQLKKASRALDKVS